MLYATKLGMRVFRQNVGMGYVGQVKSKSATHVTLHYPRPLHAGLCKGSSDLIGFTPLTITSEMVGSEVAIFTAIECKSKTGRTTKEQDNFLKAVRDSGGIAFVARQESDIDSGTREYIQRIDRGIQESCEKSGDESA